MDNFIYIEGGMAMLPLIAPLWENLRIYHQIHSTDFREVYARQTFQKRARALMEQADRGMRVELVKNLVTDQFVGYCVCTINHDDVGEIASLYIEDDYRHQGIGDSLMKSALEWLAKNQVQAKQIVVAAGNESVIEFYRRYGFYRRATTLEHYTGNLQAEY